jgi:GTP 3',8-cyclase
MMEIKDKLGRRINHLRLSVTDRCNLSCFYCHHEGNSLPKNEMETEQVKNILSEARSAGILTVKFTGGEPLLRKDIVELIRAASLAGFEDIALTTNGTLLHQMADDLRKAGLARVNIGCDSITEKMPKNISSIKKAISASKKAGISVKLNVVMLKGINDDEIQRMIDFCIAEKINLQLIELVDTNNPSYYTHFLSLEEWEKKLEHMSDMIIMREMQGRKRYFLEGIFVELVRPDKEFCVGCNKIRITADGKIRPCLIKDDGITDFLDRASIEEAGRKRDFYGYD